MLKAPYSKWEMMGALGGITEEQAKKMEKLGEETDKLVPSNKKELNAKTAEFHGITTEQLINSPNYQMLCQEFAESLIMNFIEILKKKVGLTEVQAWATYFASKGEI